MLWVWGLLVGLVMGIAVLVAWHRSRRHRLYHQMATRRSETIAGTRIELHERLERAALHQEFERDWLLRVENFLAPETFQRLQQECLENLPHLERNYVPRHKQGGTVAYETLHRTAPNCLGFYHSPELASWLDDVIGAKVGPTANYDQSSCSILCYTEPGDHIGWHFDHNFYQGRHFTALLSVKNSSAAGGVSASQLMRQTMDGQEITVDTSENVFVLFEGNKVRHKATPTQAGDLRIILSMTFGTDSRTGGLKEIIRRCKDTAFFGIRALWD